MVNKSKEMRRTRPRMRLVMLRKLKESLPRQVIRVRCLHYPSLIEIHRNQLVSYDHPTSLI